MARFAPVNSAASRKFLVWSTLLLSLYAALAFAAWEDQGVLELRIKDHRDAIGDFARLNIVIDKILISPAGGIRLWRPGWKELDPAPAVIDLTHYVDKRAARVFRGPVGAGSFDALQIKLKDIEGLLKKNRKPVPIKNSVGAVELSFQVPNRGETIIVLDLTVVDLSDHPPRGYELTIKGLELFTNGKLIHKIPPA